MDKSGFKYVTDIESAGFDDWVHVKGNRSGKILQLLFLS